MAGGFASSHSDLSRGPRALSLPRRRCGCHTQRESQRGRLKTHSWLHGPGAEQICGQSPGSCDLRTLSLALQRSSLFLWVRIMMLLDRSSVEAMVARCRHGTKANLKPQNAPYQASCPQTRLTIRLDCTYIVLCCLCVCV